MRPVIGITCRAKQDEAWCAPLVGVRQGYINAIIEAGGIPLLVPPHLDESSLRQVYGQLDGLLLSGGEDIDPLLYGEAAHPEMGAVDALRDAAELPLARWAVAGGKPLFGICRGIQVLNVALGGSLYQDLDAQRGTAIQHELGSHLQRWDHLDHMISIDPSSRLAELLGTTTTEVNSLHHQAVKALAPGLRVVAQAPDGTIEAVEGDHDAFLLAVQCHPEELWQQVEPRWRRVFGAFVAAAGAERRA